MEHMRLVSISKRGPSLRRSPGAAANSLWMHEYPFVDGADMMTTVP